MPAFDLQRVKDQTRRFADGFTSGQKMMTVLGVIVVVVAGVMFAKWAGTGTYTPLYTDLSPADAGKVAQELDRAGVKYQLADGGHTVLVGRADVYKTRVSLGAQGLPAGNHEGYALLDNGGITKSEFTQRVDYQRAVQGELGRTLEAIDGVEVASVNLTIPRDNVLAGAEAAQPTAAVLIKTVAGTRLPSEAVQAIVHIVASSVADLKFDQVTVADSAGNVLAAPGPAGDLASNIQMEHKSAVEASIATSVSNLIEKSLGPGHAAVTVQADLDMDAKEAPSTKRLSVAVLLDSKEVAAGDLAHLRTTIAAAAGIDTTTRADVLQVTRMPFDPSAAKAADAQLKRATSQKSARGMMELVRHVLTLAIIALVLFVAWRAIKRAETNRVPIRVPLDLREPEPANVGGRAQVEGLPEMARHAEPGYANYEPLLPGVQTEISELIERQPDVVAQTLRSWLADRRG